MAIRIETEWVHAEAISGPELSATWASLRIRVNDEVITRIVDRTDTVRSRVYVPLYPLAESIVTNWWFLLHEVENPAKAMDVAFTRRHSLVSAPEGYAFPNLQLTPSGERVRLVWKGERRHWSRIEFLDEGEAWIDLDEFRECCRDLVDRVVRRLLALGIEETFLQEEWAGVQAADHDEAVFCKAAAGLGLDPYALDDEARASVMRLEEALDRDWFGEAIAVLDAERLDAQVASIAAVLEAGRSNGISLERLRSIGPLVAGTGAERQVDRPWASGYALARHARQELDLSGTPLPATADLATALGEEPQALAGVMRATDFGVADLVNGVVTQDENGRPAFAVRSGHESARRFQFCRGLAEVLAAPNTDALLTQARSDRQQWSRAFAAEFLAPSAALRARVSCSTLNEDAVDELAAEFGVSSMLIAHQVQNHGIAEIR